MNENQTDNRKDNTQESLQPQRIPKEEKAYQGVLDIEERLRKEDATNIALTGPYGSGKSSILITLKEDFPDYHYLNISLATLKPSDAIVGNKDDELSKQNIDRLIEYSILQQLIYKEKQTTLPNSRFKRVFQLPEKTIIKATIAVILAFLALIIVFEPNRLKVEWLCELFGKNWMNIAGDSISIVYLLWFAYKTIKLIIPAISNSRLNKLNLKDGEIEIVENTSIFNKHLDEILYFFEQTDYNVVLLEDLDRFETTDIFLKLRELNLLLNESKVVGRKIFFIYAVRDDMFKDAERVKCFDYITTVIPVINRSNAKSQLKEELEKRGVKDIADVHLRELGFFLHDMRLLKNIANEYVQYRGKLEKGISCEKLLGMIVYKNYYPKDFADLHDCKGVIYGVVNLKEKLVAARIKDIEGEFERKQELRLRYQKERQLKETELRRIYVDAYKDKFGDNVQQIKVGDSFYSLKDIAKSEKLFEKLIGNPNVTISYIAVSGSYYAGRTQNNSLSIPFSEIEKSVDPNATFEERIEALRADYASLEETHAVEIRKEDIRSQSLSQIMSSIDYSSNADYIALKVPKLIEYLVVKGYIDENYYDYISYFYANFIDSNDWNFVLDLKLGKTHLYDYAVHNVEACLREIPSGIYRKLAILNIDIVNYLAERQTDKVNAARLSVILRTVVEEKKYDFLAAYYQSGHYQNVVFETLFSQHKDLWPDFTKYDNDSLCLKVIWYRYAEEELCVQGSREWLSRHYDFITEHLQDIEEKKWHVLIRKYDYNFNELNSYATDVLKVVAERDAYELTKHNVETIVSCLMDTGYDSLSYRIILETEHEKLNERVKNELGTCVKTIFSAPENENETEEAIVDILNSDKVAATDKVAYLSKQRNKIDLEILDLEELKTFALECDVIMPTWENVIHYMNNVSEQKTNDALRKFIEKHADELAEIMIPAKNKEDEIMLLRQLIASDVLSYDSYKILIDRFTKWYYANGVPAIEERRVGLMVAKGMIHFTQENTDSIVSGYSVGAVVAYLMHHKRDFLNAPDTIDYSNELAIGLMNAGLNMREKSIIIPCFKTEILNESLSNEVICVLRAHEISLDVDFLLKVMSLSDRTDDKIVVLNYTLEKNSLGEDVTTSLIKTLPGKYKEIAEKGKKPEIPNDVESWRLVKVLKEKDYISSYSETKNGIRVNTKWK